LLRVFHQFVVYAFSERHRLYYIQLSYVAMY